MTAGGACRRCAPSADAKRQPLRARQAAGATADPMRRRAGAALRRPPQGAARGRDDDRRSRPGRGHRPERRAGRHGPAPLGRHADLHARGRGRRSRHGRHPRHPRRRPSQQRLPPARHHPGDGLARADLCPYPADPRRRTAPSSPSATARSASTPIATSWASCPRRLFNYLLRLGWGHGDDEIIRREQAIEWFDLDARRQARRRASTSRSSRISTAIISARPTTARLAGLVAPRLETSLGRSLDAEEIELLTPQRWACSSRAPRTSTSSPKAPPFCSRLARSTLDEKAEQLLSGDAPPLLARSPCGVLTALDEWSAEATEAAVRERRRDGRRQAWARSPSRCERR